MKIKFLKLDPMAKIPTRGHDDDSGMDIYSVETYILHPGCRYTFSTGIAAKIPDGYEIQVRPRSSLSSNHGIVTMFGTVDHGYRGEIRVCLVNLSQETYTINIGDKISQLVLAPVAIPEIEEVSVFDDTTTRGIDGFGSTGK